MVASVSRARFLALKRQATRLKHSRPGTSHAQALDKIARAEGFGNWSLLARVVEVHELHEVAAAGVSESAAPQPHRVVISGFVRTRESRVPTKFWHEYIDTKYPAKRYADFKWLPDNWSAVGFEESGVRERIATAKRAIGFMDATGLRPSRAFTRVFGTSKLLPQGFDHACVWRDDANRYVVTSEPYIGAGRADAISAWCSSLGWKSVVLPNGLGIWNPCREDCGTACKRHTQMVIMASTKNGGDLQTIANTLLGIANRG